MKTMILKNGDMVITIPKEEKEKQIAHLELLEPIDDEQYNEITIMLNLIRKIPNLRLVN